MKIRLLFNIIAAWAFIFLVNTNCLAMNVTLAWDANSETDLSGYKVYYTAAETFDSNAPVLAADVAATTATIAGLDAGHSYSFAVTAYNQSNLESGFSNVVTVSETQAPSVTITSPSSSKVSGSVAVVAQASDNVGVTRVDFLINGTVVYTANQPPYQFNWNTLSVAAGSYSISAKAYDAAGNNSTATVAVTVVNDTVAPVVAITAPANSSSVAGTVAVSASATDNVGVSRVEFYLNGTLASAVNTPPYSYNWNTANYANGLASLNVKAYDAKGNVGQSTVTVTVSNILEPLTIADATLAMQISVGMVAPTTAQMVRLDVAPVINGNTQPDSILDSRDIYGIMAKIVGKTL